MHNILDINEARYESNRDRI